MSLNAPETKQTHHFLDAKAIACLPRGAIVVNAARGGMVVDVDLLAALKSGQVAAPGLDTYEGEPKLDPGYLSLKNTFPAATHRCSHYRDANSHGYAGAGEH